MISDILHYQKLLGIGQMRLLRVDVRGDKDRVEFYLKSEIIVDWNFCPLLPLEIRSSSDSVR